MVPTAETQLRLFIEQALSLKSTTLNPSGPAYHYALTLTNNPQVFSSLDEPGRDVFVSFLVQFRKFLMNDSLTNVNRVLNLSQKKLDPTGGTAQTRLREELAAVHQEWRDVLSGTFLRKKGYERPISPEHAFDILANGLVFHDDAMKSKELQSLQEIPFAIVLTECLQSLPTLVRLIERAGSLIESGLGEGLFELA